MSDLVEDKILMFASVLSCYMLFWLNDMKKIQLHKYMQLEKEECFNSFFFKDYCHYSLIAHQKSRSGSF